MLIRAKINKIRQSEYLSLFCRLVIGLIFIYSGLTKVLFPGEFAFAIQNYQILPDSLTNLAALLTPWLEIYCGLFLIAGIYQRASAILISGMLFVFIIALFSAMIRGLDINCGCFGRETQIDWRRIVEDIVLLLLSAYLVFQPSRRFTLGSFFKRLA